LMIKESIVEICVVSGKGGTGKTLVTASLAALDGNCVLVDADVDAPNLAMVVGAEEPRESHDYKGGELAVVNETACVGCGECVRVCRFDAVHLDAPPAKVDAIACEGCAACHYACPEGAVAMEERTSGRWQEVPCRFGTIVHGAVLPGEGNSGKFVTELRRHAAEIADGRTVLTDGPPGIGCPVIAALSGVDFALIVAEPTTAGLDDAARVADLARQIRLRSGLCVNKADLDPEFAEKAEKWARDNDIAFLGRLPFSSSAYEAMLSGRAPVEVEGELSAALKSLHEALARALA